jgi:hypothetical protein
MSLHRQRSRGTGVLVVGAGESALPGVSPVIRPTLGRGLGVAQRNSYYLVTTKVVIVLVYLVFFQG